MKKIIFSIALLVFTNIICFAQDVFKATKGSTVTVQKGATLYIKGGVLFDDGSTLKNEGQVTIARTSAVAANFTDNTGTAYNYGGGQFVFTGSGTQTLKSLNQFARIDVDDAGLALASTVKTAIWYLKAGKVTTGSFMAIATAATATAVQADAANTGFSKSWINGNLRRYITPATVNNYVFPAGDATRVNVAEMDNLKLNPLIGITYITASFGPKPGSDAGLNVTESGVKYNAINSGGVWYLTPDALPTAGKYDLKVYFNGFTGLADNKFAILRRPVASSNAADWMVPTGSTLPAAGTPGRTVTGMYARRNGLATFNQFGIAMAATSLAAAPVTFEATNAMNSSVVKSAPDNISKLSVYPNPVTTNNVFINYTGGNIKAITLFAMDGKQVVCSYSNIDKNLLRVNIPGATAKGTYTIQVVTEKGLLNTKIVIQ